MTVKLSPVDYDPFADDSGPSVKLTPVDYDPFEEASDPKDHWDITRSALKTVDQVQGAGYGVAKAFGGLVGSESIESFGREGVERNKAEADSYDYTDDEITKKFGADALSLPESEGISDKVGSAWDTGKLNTELGFLRYQEMEGDVSPENARRIKKIKARLKSEGRRPEIGNLFEESSESLAQLLPNMVESFKQSQVQGVQGAIMGAGFGAAAGPASPFTAPAGALAGYSAGAITGGFEASRKLEAGLAYDEMLESGIAPHIARVASHIYGAAAGAVEVAQLRTVLGTIPGGKKLMGGMLKEASAKVAEKLTKSQIMKQGALKFGKDVSTEVAQELSQEIMNIAATESAKVVSNKTAGTDINSATASEIRDRLGSVLVETTLGLGLLSGAGNVLTTSLNMRDAKVSKKQNLFDDNEGFGGQSIQDTPYAEEADNPYVNIGDSADLFPQHDQESMDQMEAEIVAQRNGEVAPSGRPIQAMVGEYRAQNQRTMDQQAQAEALQEQREQEALNSPGTHINEGQAAIDAGIAEFRRQQQISKEMEYHRQRQESGENGYQYWKDAEAGIKRQQAERAEREKAAAKQKQILKQQEDIAEGRTAMSGWQPPRPILKNPNAPSQAELKRRQAEFDKLAAELGDDIGTPQQAQPGQRVEKELPRGIPGSPVTAMAGYPVVNDYSQETPEVQEALKAVNTEPTEGQKEAGNYKKASIKVNGMDIKIENPDGSTRSGTSPDGKKWETTMAGHYGYFSRTEGKDGDQVDVIVAPGTTESPKVFVVDQVDPKTKAFDEHKVIMGVDTAEDAETLYLLNYEDGWQGMGGITEMTQDKFKIWVGDKKRTKKPLYKEPKAPTAMAGPQAPQMTYEDFKKKMNSLFNESNKYTPDEVGSQYFTDQMAELDDQYPEHSKRLWEEYEQQPPDNPPAASDTSALSGVISDSGTKSAPSGNQVGTKPETETERAINVFANNMVEKTRRDNESFGHSLSADQLSSEKEKYLATASELARQIVEKDFDKLTSRMHNGNPESLRMFRSLTGASTQNAKAIKENIRALDPEKYDAWEAAAKKDAEQNRAKKAEAEAKDARAELLSRDVGGETFGDMVPRLIKEGYSLDERKQGFATVLTLTKGDDTRVIRKSDEQAYIREEFDKAVDAELAAEEKDMQENPDKYATDEQVDHLLGKTPDDQTKPAAPPEGWEKVPGGALVSTFGEYLISGEPGRYELTNQGNGNVIGAFTDLQRASDKARQHWFENRQQEKTRNGDLGGYQWKNELTEQGRMDVAYSAGFRGRDRVRIGKTLWTHISDKEKDQLLPYLMLGKDVEQPTTSTKNTEKTASQNPKEDYLDQFSPDNLMAEWDKQAAEIKAKEDADKPKSKGKQDTNAKAKKETKSTHNKPSTAGMSPELAYKTEYRHWVKNGKKGHEPDIPSHLARNPEVLSHINQQIERQFKATETKQHLSNAVDKFKQINAILGERGSFSTEKTDENIYSQIKPLLQEALQDVIAAGKSAAEYVKLAMENLTPNARPYFERFVREDMSVGSTKEADNEDNQGRPGTQSLDTEGDQTVSGGRDGAVADDEGTGRTRPGGVLEVQPPEDVSEAENNGDSQAGSVRPAVQDAGSSPQIQGDRDVVERRENGSGEGTPSDGPGRTGRTRVENYHIEDPKLLIGGTPKKRFQKNKRAIEVYNELVDEGRDPTPEERDILAGYIGWGSFGQELFQGSWDSPIERKGWAQENEWLRQHLGENAWKAAQASIINAHYTDPPTVSAIWDMIRKLGFTGGRVLEPSVGVGNFFGLMPKDLKAASDLTGIELDNTTAGIAKMLYPKANIQQMGYEKSKTADGFYDVVVGNWPFAKDGPVDRRYDKFRLSLHDYFFVKALDQVRPGGFVIGITSSGTMDKKNKVARLQMAKRGNLVAAFRMPSGAFEEYAGTAVVADILVFQKREKGQTEDHHGAWGESVPMVNGRDQKILTADGREVFVNEYWAEHPDHVLGEMTVGHGTTQGREGMIVNRPRNYQDRLNSIIDVIPKGIITKRNDVDHIQYISNNTDERQNSIVSTRDGLYVVQGERLAPLNDVSKYKVKSEKTTKDRENQINALVRIGKSYGQLLDLERAGSEKTETIRTILNNQYNSFVKRYGSINQSFALKMFLNANDPMYHALKALENNTGTKKNPVYEPATIFTQSTQRTKKEIKNPSISDALVLVRNEDALHIDIDDIANRANTTVTAVKEELFKKNAIFETPAGAFEVADIYLSGNVRRKLTEALDAKDRGLDMDRNIKALKAVIPDDVPYFNIEASLGATWVPAAEYQNFLAEVANLPVEVAETIRLTPSINGWIVKFQDPSSVNGREEVRTMWTPRGVDFTQVIRAAFTGQSLQVKVTDSDGNTFVDSALSLAANEKVDELRSRFKDWIWSDVDRRVALENIYNETMNAFVTPEYDGSFLNFDGMALQLGDKEFNLRQHQANAIWRGIANGRGLYAHEVGTGKTFTMAGIAIESRRYGLAKKPLILGHNANSKSVARDINVMYPGAKVLYIDNLSPKTIESKLYQIANDDWDAVVLPHSLLDRLTLTRETLNRIAEEEISALEAEAIDSAADEGFDIEGILDDEEELRKVRGATTAKELVKQRNRIIANIDRQAQQSSREGAIPFESLGIDMLIIDEAHEFKKPPISTRMRVKGLNIGTSNRSIGLNFLTSYIKELNGGRGIHTFTGTPITNTMNEVYNHMRYVMADKMDEAGVLSWDAWFNTFAGVESDIEMTAAGDYQAVSRLSEFNNVTELRRFAGQYMDIVFADDMPEFSPRETASGKTMKDKSLTDAEKKQLLDGRVDEGDVKGRPYKRIVNEVAEMSPEQEEILETLMQRAMEFRNADGKTRRQMMLSGSNRNPVVVETDAAKAGFDARLYDKDLSDHPQNKINRCAKNVLEHYVEHGKTAQVIFMEKGFNDTAKRSRRGMDGERVVTVHETFNAAKDLVNKLVEGGIPREEIAMVTGKTTKKKRLEIADDVNKAKIRVVIGQTATLGTGVNMQENLRAIHHMDAPWMPGELEQRNGRGHRQGNRWNTVLEYRYITNRIDAKRWQVLAKKQKMIIDFLKAKEGVRSISGDVLDMNESSELEDITASFAEAAGDARILMRTKLAKDIEKLKRRERSHGQGVVDAKTRASQIKNKLPEEQKHLEKLKKDMDLYLENKDNPFLLTLDGKQYTDRKEAGVALEKASIKYGNHEETTIGSYRGFDVVYSGVTKKYYLEKNHFYSVVSSIGSFDANLRGIEKKYQKKAQEIADQEQAITKLEESAKEKFGQADLLKKKENMLAQIEADLQQFPDAPPAWLAQGAPIGTEVYYNGKAYEVEGHRKGEESFYLLLSDPKNPNGNPEVITYDEAMDANNIPVYEPVDVAEQPQYSITSTSPWKQDFPNVTTHNPKSPVTPEKVKAYFNSLKLQTGTTPEGHLWVKAPSGLGFTVETVKRFSDKEYEIAINSGAMEPGGHIAGNLVGHKIKVSSDFGDKATLLHEVVHLLENSGLLTKMDLSVLDTGLKKRKGLEKGDKIPIVKDKRENRANYLSRVLVNREQFRGTALGRVLQKIADFMDALYQIARATVGKENNSVRQIARGMETGEIYKRQFEDPDALNEPALQYRADEKIGSTFTFRKGPAPKKTKKVYKAFREIDGKLYPMFVGSSGAGVENVAPLPMGEWLDANDGGYHFTGANGKQYVPTFNKRGGDSVKLDPEDIKTKQELVDRGYISSTETKSVTAVAYRPGWHAGNLPYFPQAGAKSKNGPSNYKYVHEWNTVIAEVEIDADQNFKQEYEDTAHRNKNGKINHKLSGIRRVPLGGYYEYTTNPILQDGKLGNWFISGSAKINRIVKAKEADAILEKNGFLPQEWEAPGPLYETKRNTETPAFKRWFGDSKVVDENGDPLMVYHGTNADFDQFDLNANTRSSSNAMDNIDGSLWFAQSPQVGSFFAGEETGASVLPAYISVKNPLIIDMSKVKEVSDQYFNIDGLKVFDIRYVKEKFVNKAKRNGHDGVIFKNGFDGVPARGDIYSVFNPKQAKSVYNQGTWNPEDPRIQYKVTEPKQTPTAEQDNETIKGLFHKDKTWIDAIKGFATKSKSKEERDLAGDRLIAKTLDHLHFIQRRLGGRAYRMHRMLTGIKSATFAMFLEHGALSWDGDAPTVKTKGKGVLPFLQSIGQDYQNLLLWIAAKRAEQLDAEGRENWITADKRAAIFRKVGTHAKNGQTWAFLNKRFQTINKNVLDFAEAAGLIDPESRAMWEQNFYIPFYRVFENEATREEFLSGPKGAKKHITAQIRQLKGGEAEIGDLLQNSLTNWMFLIDAAARNKARGIAFDAGVELGMITEVPKKDLINILGAQTEKKYAVMKDGARNASALFDYEDDAQDHADKLSERYGKGYSVEPRKTTTIKFGNMKDLGVLSFQRDGKPVYFKCEDQDLFDSMSEIDAQQFNFFLMKAMGQAKRTLSYGATFGPAFRIRNMVRDSVHTAVVSKSFVPFYDTALGFMKSMREDPEYIEFMASGFGFGSSYVHSDDPKVGAKYIKRILKSEGKGAVANILTSPKRILDLWEKIGAASENAARVKLYSNLKGKGLSTFDAGFEGRDLMDFSMRGSSKTVQTLTRITPFLNARFQGLYKLSRAAKENPKAFIVKSSILTAASLALWGLYKDDDRYKELQDWDKWTYFHIWLDGQHYRIPKPFEIGAIFCSLPESIGNVINGTEEGKFVVDWALNTARNTFQIDIIPQVIKPYVDAEIANKNTFTGRPIVSDYMGKLPPEEQYNPWTSKTAREIGKRLGMSPLKIEHYISGYLATMGKIILDGTDILLNEMGDYPEDPDTTIAEDIFGRSKAWGLGVAEPDGPARSTKYLTRFYERYEKLDNAKTSFNHFKKTGDAGKTKTLVAERGREIVEKQIASKVKSMLTDINAEIRRVQVSRLSGEEKRRKLESLQKTRNEMTKNYFNAVRENKK